MSNKNKLNLLKNCSNSTKEEVCISLVGPVGCGKSSLVVKYLTRRFIGEYDPFYEGCWTKIENIDNVDMNVQIMDTYDKRKNLDKIYKWSDIMILVYSIIDKESFVTIQEYIENINEIIRINHDETISDKNFTKIVLLGNKIDMERYRQVNKNDVENLIRKYNYNTVKKISDSTNTIINDVNMVNNTTSLNLIHVESTSCEEYDIVQNLFHRLIRETKREKELFQNMNQSKDESNLIISKISKSKFTKSRAKSPKANANNIIPIESNINSLSTSPPFHSNSFLDSSFNLNQSSSIPTSNSFSNTSSSQFSSTGTNNNSFTLNNSIFNRDNAGASNSKKNSSKFPFFNKILNKS
ncbi:unnamed protein product [Brachionus calyciflorus]|uniref:small monomeric GTPase n=1 Tax=Brachionus calyciflorus TaxID=104777 RepID=A0A813M3M7_9BILA|nr:unnamed protein product [Brachionus calyciflorus]